MTRRPSRKDDCLRQCLSRLLGLKPGQIPHFVKKYRGRWTWHMNRWLERRGYHTIICKKAVISEGVRQWINIGPTRKGRHHAVLMRCPQNKPGFVAYDGGNPLKRVDRSLIIIRSIKRKPRRRPATPTG